MLPGEVGTLGRSSTHLPADWAQKAEVTRIVLDRLRNSIACSVFLLPKIPKPLGRELGVARGVLDVAVAQPLLAESDVKCNIPGRCSRGKSPGRGELTRLRGTDPDPTCPCHVGFGKDQPFGPAAR